MARQKVDLIGDLAILRGATFDLWKPQLSGDWTLWTPKAEIRTNYLSSDGELKAGFDHSAATYDAEEDLTTFNPYLTPAKTLLLPVTKYQGGDLVPSVKNCLVWDWQIALGGVVYSLAAGFVQVQPEVTENA
jgi:hypothetical protein